MQYARLSTKWYARRASNGRSAIGCSAIDSGDNIGGFIEWAGLTRRGPLDSLVASRSILPFR